MLTSKDLLYKALDYDGFWNASKRMTNSKPSQARKLQLDKLLAAFNISKENVQAESQVARNVDKDHKAITVYAVSNRSKPMNRLEYVKTLTDFKYFSSGEFLADKDRSKYKAFIKQTVVKAKQIFPAHSEAIDTEPINLVHLFHTLYNFRLSVYHMFNYSFNARTQEQFSIENDYSLYLRKQFTKSMNNNLSEVDKLLYILIDPAKRKFKEDETGYPHYDFEALDKEWKEGLRQ
ncbi:MAG: hypothetical protein INR73_06980 [Williamsia sp.]|nr:hypothetical protein [Williamsia sp.]